MRDPQVKKHPRIITLICLYLIVVFFVSIGALWFLVAASLVTPSDLLFWMTLIPIPLVLVSAIGLWMMRSWSPYVFCGTMVFGQLSQILLSTTDSRIPFNWGNLIISIFLCVIVLWKMDMLNY